MMSTLFLAAGGEDVTMKLIVGAVVAVFWIGSQILGSLAKKPGQRVPPARPTGTGKPPPARTSRIPTLQVPPRFKKSPPPPATPRRAMQAAPPPLNAQKAMTARSVPAAPASADVESRRKTLKLLLQPRELKRAYILTEVLQPPVSLRQSD